MTVTLYQLDKETYLWTKEELDELIKNDNSIFSFHPPHNSDNNYEFELHGHKIRFFGNASPFQIRFNGFKEEQLSELNVCILYGVLNDEEVDTLLNSISKFSNHKFVLIAKHTEDYWVSNSLMQSPSLLERIGEMKNVRVIWDIKLEWKNFIFHPKILFHNYHNQPNFQSGHIFEHSYNLFKRINKEFRIGFHINKLTTKIRRRISAFVENNPHPKLFYTNTKTHQSAIFTPTIVPSLRSGNITQDWYLKQFVEMTCFSDMELVYETSTHNVSFPHLIKWNEKTIKLLMLGKPFIHLDPIAHSLMNNFGIKPYESLYTPQLLEYYNSYSYTQNLRSESELYFSSAEYEKWIGLVTDNIQWLLSLSDEEYSKRLSLANTLASENRLHIHSLLFSTSLLSLITSPTLFDY